MESRVYRSTGSWYLVKHPEQGFVQARMKGRFRMDDITSTNPVAVGDWVDIVREEGPEASWVITDIRPRRNYVNRRSPAHRHRHHIVAANLDQSLLVATLRDPRTSQGFVDRFLTACEAFHVPAALVVNKCDLFRPKDEERFLAWEEMYTAVGYRVFRTSAVTGEGIEDLKAWMAGRTTLVSGHSGVGKSTLINLLQPDLSLRTAEVSGWSGKGMHTTTFAEMFDLPGGGAIIDTPGIREFGLVDITPTELSHYFPEMRKRIGGCQFNDCRHMDEPGCAVKAAVEEGEIHPERYISYCTILDSLEEDD